MQGEIFDTYRLQRVIAGVIGSAAEHVRQGAALLQLCQFCELGRVLGALHAKRQQVGKSSAFFLAEAARFVPMKRLSEAR